MVAVDGERALSPTLAWYGLVELSRKAPDTDSLTGPAGEADGDLRWSPPETGTS